MIGVLLIFLLVNCAPPMALRRTSRLHINLFLHDLEASTKLNSTHTETAPYDPTHEYATHCRTILKKNTGLRSAFIGFPPTSSASLTPSNTFILPTPSSSSVSSPSNFQFSKSRVHVILGLPRPLVLQRVLKTLATFGVGSVQLLKASKTEPQYFGSHLLRGFTCFDPSTPFNATTPLGETVVKGLEQGGHPYPPQIHVRKSLWKLDLRGRGVVPHPRRTSKTVSEVLRGAGPEEDVTVAIGPESGWTDEEIEWLEGRGFDVVTLGAEILTVGEAATATVGIVRDAVGSNP
mmetsp:Transcript_26276/g.54724  ORF Transcript_26276/g.54724 Transcript_26276/m.54724 type:complete len:291 (-) Transcript_26276:16-888(-)